MTTPYITMVDMLHTAYDIEQAEKGYTTKGHHCVTADERGDAENTGVSLLYGELLPEGLSILLDADHLDAANAKTIIDLGSGLGKAALQSFLQYPNLEKVTAVEISESRYSLGVDALKRLHGEYSSSTSLMLTDSEEKVTSRCTLTTTVDPFRSSKKTSHLSKVERAIFGKKKRTIEFRSGSLFDASESFDADIVVCQTKIPDHVHDSLCRFLAHVKPSAKVLTYENLDALYEKANLVNPFIRLEKNTSSDRVFTSWATNKGHRFHLWSRSDMPAADIEKTDSKISNHHHSLTQVKHSELARQLRQQPTPPRPSPSRSSKPLIQPMLSVPIQSINIQGPVRNYTAKHKRKQSKRAHRYYQHSSTEGPFLKLKKKASRFKYVATGNLISQTFTRIPALSNSKNEGQSENGFPLWSDFNTAHNTDNSNDRSANGNRSISGNNATDSNSKTHQPAYAEPLSGAAQATCDSSHRMHTHMQIHRHAVQQGRALDQTLHPSVFTNPQVGIRTDTQPRRHQKQLPFQDA